MPTVSRGREGGILAQVVIEDILNNRLAMVVFVDYISCVILSSVFSVFGIDLQVLSTLLLDQDEVFLDL